MEQQLLGWKNDCESGVGVHATTSGFEGAWNSTPTQWDNNYLETLMDNEWELTESPAVTSSGRPALAGTVPDAAWSRGCHAHPDDDHRRHVHEDGPDLQRDQPAVPRRTRRSSTMRSPEPGSS